MSKICGECKHFISCSWVTPDVIADNCEDFEQKFITNGDIIRRGGNRELAEYFVYETGAMWASTMIVDKTFETYDKAVEATEAYLNAPAESKMEE